MTVAGRDADSQPGRAFAGLGARVFAQVLKEQLRSEGVLQPRDGGGQQASHGEVSEEIVVYGERDPGGGGVDVIQIPIEMFMVYIENIPILDIPPGWLPGPGGGDDTPDPPPDPCAGQQNTVDTLEAVQAADQLALDVLQEQLDGMQAGTEKRELRREIRELKDSLAETAEALENAGELLDDCREANP